MLFHLKLIPTDMRFDANGNPPCYSSEDQVCIKWVFFLLYRETITIDTCMMTGDTEGCAGSIKISWYSS